MLFKVVNTFPLNTLPSLHIYFQAQSQKQCPPQKLSLISSLSISNLHNAAYKLDKIQLKNKIKIFFYQNKIPCS